MSVSRCEALAEKSRLIASYAAFLANPVRAAILLRLVEGPCIVGELARCAQAEQPVVSKQIGLLRAGGLIHCHPEGRCREYALSAPDATRALLSLLSDSAERASRHSSVPAPRRSRGKILSMEES